MGAIRQQRVDYPSLVGNKYGRLTVIGINEEETAKHKRCYLECKCDCGKTVAVNGADVVRGATTSCGCARKDKATRCTEVYMNDDRNYGIAFINDKGDFDKFISFSAEDKDLILSGAWHTGKGDYIEGYARNSGTKSDRVVLHRTIAERQEPLEDGKVVDHVDHNKFELRRPNLKACTKSENNMNRKGVFSSEKDAKHKYIWYDPVVDLFKVIFNYIDEDGKPKRHTKAFKKEEDAILYRDSYIIEHSDRYGFMYDENRDVRNNPARLEYTIAFPNNNLHPFYIVDGVDMCPPNPLEVIQPFTNMPPINYDVQDKIIQPFTIINEIRFNKGGH